MQTGKPNQKSAQFAHYLHYLKNSYLPPKINRKKYFNQNLMPRTIAVLIFPSPISFNILLSNTIYRRLEMGEKGGKKSINCRIHLII